MDWKWVPIVGGILAILFGIWKVDDRYAKCEDVKAKLQEQEVRVVQTLEKFQDKLDYKTQRDRLDAVKDQSRAVRIQMKKLPNDLDLKEQLSDLERERMKIEDRLRELEKKK